MGRVKRVFCAGLVLAMAGVASASFELVMAMDRGNFSTAGRIHRYDGDTGAYLGSFGQGWVDSTSTMALSQSLGVVTISSNGFVRTFDYNTGQMRQSQAIGVDITSMASLSNGDVLLAAGGLNALVRYNPITGAQTLNAVPTGVTTFPPLAAFLAVNGNTWYFGDTNNTLTWRSPNAGANWVRTSVNPASGLFVPNYSQAIFSGNVFGDYYIAHRTEGSLYYDFGANLFGAVAIQGFTGTTGLAVGHAGKAFIMGTTATGAQIQTMDRWQSQGFRFSASQVVNPGYLAAVVAPEPGTLTALALGLVAVLNRRRKK